MSLVYADCWTVEEVYYEKHDGNWTYIQTDVFKPENYYTKLQVDNLISTEQDRATGVEATKADKSTTYTKSEVDALIAALVLRIEALEAEVFPTNEGE